MDDAKPRPKPTDTLQSGEGNPAPGEDARAFGVGGQVSERALDQGKDDRPERDVERDESLPENAHPSRSER